MKVIANFYNNTLKTPQIRHNASYQSYTLGKNVSFCGDSFVSSEKDAEKDVSKGDDEKFYKKIKNFSSIFKKIFVGMRSLMGGSTSKEKSGQERKVVDTPILENLTSSRYLDKINIATEEELKVVQKICIENSGGKYNYNQEEFEKYNANLKNKNIQTYVLKNDENKITGYYQIEPDQYNEVSVYSIGISEDIQDNNEVCSAFEFIQNDIIKISQKENTRRITLEIDANNTKLTKLSKDFGYKLSYKEQKTIDGTKKNIHHMEFDVKKPLIDKYLSMKIDGKERFSIYEAETLSYLTEEERTLMNERHLLDEYVVNDEYGTSIVGFNVYQIFKLLKVPQKTWEYMENSKLKENMSPYNFVQFDEISDEQWERAFKDGFFPQNDEECSYSVGELRFVLDLPEKSWNRYIKDIDPEKYNIKICDLTSFSTVNNLSKIMLMDDQIYSRFKEIMKIERENEYGTTQPITLEEFSNMAENMDNLQWERVKNDLYNIDYLKSQLSTSEIFSLTQLDKKEYGRVLEVIKGFQSREQEFDLSELIPFLLNVAQLNKETFNRIKPYITSNIIDSNIENLARLSELDSSQQKRLEKEILDFKLPFLDKVSLAKLPDEKFKEAKDFVLADRIKIYNYDSEEKLTFSTLLKLLELEPEQYKKAKELLILEDSDYQMLIDDFSVDIINITDDMLNRFKNDLLPLVKNSNDNQENPNKINNKLLPFSMHSVLQILALPEEKYQDALNNLKDINSTKNDVTIHNIMPLVLMDRDKFIKIRNDLFYVEALDNNQLNANELFEIGTEFDDEKYDRCINEIIPNALKYFKFETSLEYVNPIIYTSKLTEKDYEKFKKTLSYMSNMRTWEIKDIVNLSDNQLDVFLKRSLTEIPIDLKSNLELSKLTEDKYKSMRNTLIYFDKNIELLQHQDIDVSREMVSQLIVENKDGVLNTIDLIGETGMRHATELRYKGLKQFLENASSLKNLNGKERNVLKSKMEKLPHPEQKVAKLEIVSALVGKVDKKALNNIINNIDSPQVTENQREQVNKIFLTKKSYQEQIEDFINIFDVPAEKQHLIRKFLSEHKINEKYVVPQSLEEQLAIMDKKIQSITQNDKIPSEKKQAYLNQLNLQKSDIVENPEKYTQPKINEKAMKALESQIEAHINLPNQNKKFAKTINEQVYNVINVRSTNELLSDINYDSKYISKLFAGLSNTKFKSNFIKLIELVKENPNKKFTEIIRNLPENIETEKMFEENGLNYDRWVNCDKNITQKFTLNVDIEKVVNAAKNNLINEFDSSLAINLEHSEIEKLKQILKENNIETASQGDLSKIIKQVEKEIENNKYWEENSPDIKTFKDHIQIHKKNIQDIEKIKNVSEELSVKLWDKNNVGRNIFFGNHVGCCTSIGSFNSYAAPQHLMNTYINGIEIVDKSGTSMGNSMCFFANVDDKLTFIIDSFEANGKLGAAPEVTDAIIDFAKKLCSEMGQPEANIMFGPNYNKIDFSRCVCTKDHTIKVIGKAPEVTYIDSLGGTGSINVPQDSRRMYEVADL